MTKEFTVPPVLFLSGGRGLQQRRVPTVPSQPPRPPNPTIPFVSANSTTSFSAPVYGSTVAGLGARFVDEAPLLEELGIDPTRIWNKTVSMINPVRVNPKTHDESDLSGPFLYYMAFCVFQLLAGKVQFGIVLGWTVVFSIFLYVVLDMLAGRSATLSLHRCVSVVGYCMLPIVIFSAVSLLVRHGGIVIFVMAAVFVMWSTRVCARLLVELAPRRDELRGLIGYGCLLCLMLVPYNWIKDHPNPFFWILILIATYTTFQVVCRIITLFLNNILWLNLSETTLGNIVGFSEYYVSNP